jgi:hypothetical protein
MKRTKENIDEVVKNNPNIEEIMPQLFLPNYKPTSNKATAAITSTV